MSRRTFLPGLALVLLAGLLLRGWNLGRPPEAGWHELGLSYAVAGRNHLRHGLAATRGLMATNAGPAEPEELRYYVRHPPLLPLIHAAAIGVFGNSLRVYRCLLITLSACSLLLLAALVAHCYGRKAALLAALVYGLCPQAVIFATGGDVAGEGVNTFVLLGLFGRLVVGRRRPLGGTVLEHAGYTLAALYDWAGFLAFGIPLLAAVVQRRDRRALLRGAASLLLAGLLFGLHAWWVDRALADLPGKAEAVRVTENPLAWTAVRVVKLLAKDPEQAWQMAGQALRRQAQDLTWVLTALLALAVPLSLVRRGRPRATPSFPLLLVLGAVGGGYCLLMLSQYLVHDYVGVLLMPWLAAASGVLLARLWEAGRPKLLVMAWLAAFAGLAVTRSVNRLESFRAPGVAAACSYLRRHTDPEDLLLLYGYNEHVFGWCTARNVVPGVQDPDLPPRATSYLARHPEARVFIVLAPVEAAGTAAARRHLIRTGRQLDALFPVAVIGGHRIYDTDG